MKRYACHAGVSDNRVQNVAITLDKARLVLQQPGQSQQPPLRLCSDEEVMDHLWSGEFVSRLLVSRPCSRGASPRTQRTQCCSNEEVMDHLWSGAELLRNHEGLQSSSWTSGEPAQPPLPLCSKEEGTSKQSGQVLGHF